MCVPSLLFPLLAKGFWSGAIFRFIAGAGQVISYTSGIQLVAARFDPKLWTTAVSIFVGLAYGGSTVSYVVMGLLLQSTSEWRDAYLLLAGISSIQCAGHDGVYTDPFITSSRSSVGPVAPDRPS